MFGRMWRAGFVPSGLRTLIAKVVRGRVMKGGRVTLQQSLDTLELLPYKRLTFKQETEGCVAVVEVQQHKLCVCVCGVYLQELEQATNALATASEELSGKDELLAREVKRLEAELVATRAESSASAAAQATQQDCCSRCADVGRGLLSHCLHFLTYVTSWFQK
eukprot:2899694-Amphidinium_carterae.2